MLDMKQNLIQNIVLSGLLCLSLAFPRVARAADTRVFTLAQPGRCVPIVCAISRR